jgi:hypothetical protein
MPSDRAIAKHTIQVDKRIKELFERYQSGTATDEEIKLVEQWFARFSSGQKQILAGEDGGNIPDDKITSCFICFSPPALF